MSPNIRKVAVIANLLKPDAGALVDSISAYFESRSIAMQLVGFKGKPEHTEIDENVDLAFSLGGDGTVLYCARLLAGHQVPILAVNIGDFGFITEVSKHEWMGAFEEYAAGRVGVSKRLMLEVEVQRDGERSGPFVALNDALISAHNISKVVRLGVRVSETELGKYRADGVLVASPTGSTAYSMAAGGPILDPEMEALLLIPICPFTLSNRPLVVPADDEIIVEVEGQKAEVILTLDGQTLCPLRANDRIHIRRAAHKALIVRSNRRNFFDVLRAKLKWSGGPDA